MYKMVKAKKWVKARHFDGMPTLDDFRCEEEEVDTTLKDGGQYRVIQIIPVESN